MAKISKSILKDLIKECVRDMIREGDSDIVALLGEGKKINSVEKVVADEELWDSLVEVATGTKKIFKKNNKRIKSPNAGIGYKSSKKINEWVKAAYNKFDGEWKDKVEDSSLISESSEPSFKNDEKSIEKGILGDKLMSAIFADTAKNTLVQQDSAHANSQPHDRAAMIMKEQDPTELFGDSAKNWSSLAFDE